MSPTFANHFDAPLDGPEGIAALSQIAQDLTDTERVVFFVYHATGAVSGAFMLRKGRWKLSHYIGFEDEPLDLEVALIRRHGGFDAAMKQGAPSATCGEPNAKLTFLGSGPPKA